MQNSRFQLIKAAQVVKNDGVIAYPTESVYGLGCNPLSEAAVTKILNIKHRPVEKGLIIIAASLRQLHNYIKITKEQERKISARLTPTTWLVNKSDATPPWISGAHPKIAIRVSSHALVIELCNLLKQPIVSTSANPSRARPATTNFEARKYFNNSVDYYLNGLTGSLDQPTPILDIDSDFEIRK